MDFKTEYYTRLLLDNGFNAFYAFETARDLLLHRDKQPASIDILTNADLSIIARLFPEISFRKEHSDHAYLSNDGLVVKFYVSDNLPERTRDASNQARIKTEALKRATSYTPFIINGFFYDIENQIFYDPLDAYPFLKKGVIKTNRPPLRVFKAFPLLALKAAKTYTETGFSIDEELNEFLKEKASLTPYERINGAIAQDFIEICSLPGASRALRLLDDWGVLNKILPELTALKEVNQDKDHHPEGNGFLHTLHCLNCVKKPNKNLMMAILLHDTGKALTKNNGKSSLPFPEHSSASKLIAKKILRRLRFTKEDTEEVLFLVRNHMILSSIDSLPEGRLKKIYTTPWFQNLLELYRADIESGYHSAKSYYRAARRYREFLRKQKFIRQGTYVKHH